jgi:hypothetical protein
LALALPSCSSSSSATEPATIPDVTGSYTITGTYSPRTGSDTGLFGTMDITGQTGGTATASMAVKLLDHGNTSFALNTPDDAVSATVPASQAVVGSDGSFTLEFSGREEITGIDPADCCQFTFAFSGTVGSSGAISGSWVLTTDMPSQDNGTFNAAP